MSISLFCLCLLAGWLVNVTADALPARQTLSTSWHQPFDALASLLPCTGYKITIGSPGHLYPRRTLMVWLSVVCLGWLAEQRTDNSIDSFILAAQAWFFLAIAVIDLEHRLVFNRMLLWAVPFTLLSNWFTHSQTLASIVWGAWLGLALFAPISVVWPGSIGMGDAKLASFIGLSFGLYNLWVVLLLSAWAGGIVGLVMLIRNRFRRGQTMAYAPYLVFGSWVVLFFNLDQGSRSLEWFR